MAHEFGIVDIDWMLEGMTYGQFTEWTSYFNEVGFETDNAEIRKGELLATLVNLQRTKPSDKVYNVSDFIRKRFDSESNSTPVDETGSKLDVLKAMLSAKR